MKKFNIILASIATLGFALLVGQALGLRAFGGDGLITYPSLNMQNQTWERGSTFTFVEDGEIQPHEQIQITGEKGTVLIFLDTRPDSFTVNLITGRIKVLGKITAWTNQLAFSIDGDTELIHYSWKNTAEMTVREGVSSYDYKGYRLAQPLIAPAQILLPTSWNESAEAGD